LSAQPSFSGGGKTTTSLIQLLGAVCLVIVILAHVSEALRIFPWMGWGLESSVGHYLDLSGAILGASLFPIGFLLRALKGNGASVGLARSSLVTLWHSSGFELFDPKSGGRTPRDWHTGSGALPGYAPSGALWFVMQHRAL
jgi:hypothetical protein